MFSRNLHCPTGNMWKPQIAPSSETRERRKHWNAQIGLWRTRHLLASPQAIRPSGAPFRRHGAPLPAHLSVRFSGDTLLAQLITLFFFSYRYLGRSPESVEKWLTREKTPHPQTLINEHDEGELTSRNHASYVWVLCSMGGSV